MKTKKKFNFENGYASSDSCIYCYLCVSAAPMLMAVSFTYWPGE